MTINVNNTRNVVVIRGDPDKVTAVEPVARQQIKEAVRAEATVSFPNDRLGALLGTKGSRIKQLQVLCGAVLCCAARLVCRRGFVVHLSEIAVQAAGFSA